jgi:protein-S-isoprenylcysteine O-methyltransferase Ste14
VRTVAGDYNPRMATSRSTPRLRLTAALLGLVIVLVSVSERDSLAGAWGELSRLAGLALVACAALGRVWTSAFIAGFKDTRLVRTGPYAACRHPLYALSWLGMLGLGLGSRSLAVTLGLGAAFALVFAAAIRREDALLATLHGDGYAAYRKDVPALWPRWPAESVPERTELRPRVFFKSIVDAASLIGVYLLLQLADLAQATGLTPTLLRLP